MVSGESMVCKYESMVKVPVGDTIFTRDGTAILRGHPSHEKV